MKNKEPHNILITTYFSYSDALIQTYTLPYAKIISRFLPPGSKIYLVTLDRKKEPPADLSEWNIERVSLRYQPLGFKGQVMWFKAITKLFFLIHRARISTIHGWCTTGGMMAYILAKLTARTLIVDSYEPHAEAMVENGEWKKDSPAFKLLHYFEKKQTWHAKYLIANTAGMKKYALEKFGYTGSNYFVKPACVDTRLFKLQEKNRELLRIFDLEHKIVCVYAGKLGGIYLEDEVFAFIKVCETFWKSNFRFLMLNNNSDEYIEQKRIKHGIAPGIIKKTFVPHAEINQYINLADFGLCPVKPVPSKQFCSPIKNGEYWAMGLPVVITRNISTDSDTIEKHDIGYVLKELNEQEYLNAAKKTDILIRTAGLREKIRQVAIDTRSFTLAEEIYRQIYS